MKLVLSISGGGIRGIIPAIILTHIEKRVGKPIANCFDLIAGTSTGGIIAALLTVPDINYKVKYSSEQIVKLYKQFGKRVFKSNLLRKLITLDGLIGTKYSCKPLETLLKEYFGKTDLSQTLTNLIIPAYQINQDPYPYFFKTLHAKYFNNSFYNPKLWECARATSSANGYFKPFKFDESHTFLDGGLFANNPAMCAYSQAKSTYGNNEKIILVSIGTGENLVGYSYEKIRNWGIVQWAVPFFKQTSISSSETIDYMLRTLSRNGDRYYYLQTTLDKESLKMDDVSDENIFRLEKAAEKTIRNNAKLINEIVSILK